MNNTVRHLVCLAAVLGVSVGRGQAAPDTLGALPDHWVVMDLKKWAWYLNFTSQQKEAVRAIDAQYAQREARLETRADYVDTEEQRAARRALVSACIADVQAALDPGRFIRWQNLRNGAQPVKPTAGGTMFRLGPVRF